MWRSKGVGGCFPPPPPKKKQKKKKWGEGGANPPPTNRLIRIVLGGIIMVYNFQRNPFPQNITSKKKSAIC